MRSAMASARTQYSSQNPWGAFVSQLMDNGGQMQEIQFLNLVVSRNNIVEDTIRQLYPLNTHELKKPLRV